MAVATPTMFPVPTRPERAMQKASNEEIPLAPSFLLNSERSMVENFRTCTKRVRTEKYRPATMSSATRTGFQTMELIEETTLSSID